MYPAVALLEFSSVAAGIVAGDAMVKRAPVDSVVAGTVQPGHYLVLVSGDVASVEEAVDAARAATPSMLDEVVLPDIHPDVVAAVRGERVTGGDALGIVETTTVASLLRAADRGVKGAGVTLREIHLADGLGGKAYVLFGGTVSDVEAAVEIAAGGVAPSQLVAEAVIASLHDEMDDNLAGHPRFGVRSGREDSDATG